MWAIFGYKENDNFGDFLAEAKTKEDLKAIEDLAKAQGYVKFSYSCADGSMPNFTNTINI